MADRGEPLSEEDRQVRLLLGIVGPDLDALRACEPRHQVGLGSAADHQAQPRRQASPVVGHDFGERVAAAGLRGLVKAIKNHQQRLGGRGEALRERAHQQGVEECAGVLVRLALEFQVGEPRGVKAHVLAL